MPPLPRNCVGGRASQVATARKEFRMGRRGARMIPEPGDLPDREADHAPDGSGGLELISNRSRQRLDAPEGGRGFVLCGDGTR